MELLAITDGLTQLHNHKHFQEQLAKELERTKRYKRPVSLLMMDIDHFKSFNDTMATRWAIWCSRKSPSAQAGHTRQ